MDVEGDGCSAVPKTSTREWPRTARFAVFAVVVLNACSGGGDPAPPRTVATISISPADLTLEALGVTSQLGATARAHGTATITATVRGPGRSVSDSVEITVRRPLTVSGNPNVYDSRSGRTPLHITAMANAPKLIAALVAAGADVEARDRDGLTALHAAAFTNSLAAIAALLQAGELSNET